MEIPGRGGWDTPGFFLGAPWLRVARSKYRTRPTVMALVCILLLAGWTPVVLGELAIPGVPVEELKQKIVAVPVTKVRPSAATGA